jgi:preprotein translocase subunit SecG
MRGIKMEMTRVDWILAAFVVIGSIALAFIGDYPEFMKW